VYQVLVNGDFVTSRGVEVQFTRRLSDRWGYDINYSLSRTTTNSRPPERANEISRNEAASRVQLFESLSDIDQPQRFNAQLQFAVRDDTPKLPGNLGRLLKNTRLTMTYQWASGFPYTPVRGDAFGLQAAANVTDINAGRAPSTQQIDMVFNKALRINNLNYSLFLQVNNLFDRKNCVQVFVNNGTCESGLRDFTNRSVGNTGDASTSTAFDQPEYVGARRTLQAGISLTF
jgi:outer membrane receptor protein involved in Fe transport